VAEPGTSSSQVPTTLTTYAVDNPHIIQKMTTFHNDIASLQTPKYVICQECFPSLKIDETGHCVCCHSDKKKIRNYSRDENMDPGPLPSALQASFNIVTISQFTM